MAQTNYTPISLYYSSTASAVPLAANLVNGELAINTNDGKLYYKDSSSVVQVIASKATGSLPGASTQVIYNSGGTSLAGSANLTFDGTNVQLGAAGALRFANTANSFYVAFKGPTGTAANVTWTLPSVDGTSGQALSTNGSGTLSWAAAGGSPGGSTTQVQYNNAGAFGGVSGFTTDGTRVTASTTIGVGGATPSTSGSGVTFPATQSASTDVNTLDDYEEGTWTPVISDGTNNATMTTTSGNYVKIGSMVYITCNAYVAAIGSLSGPLRIIGLPFTISGDGSGVACGYGQQLSITAGNAVSLYGASGTTYYQLRIWNATTGTGQLAASNLIGANSGVGFSLTYRTT